MVQADSSIARNMLMLGHSDSQSQLERQRDISEPQLLQAEGRIGCSREKQDFILAAGLQGSCGPSNHNWKPESSLDITVGFTWKPV